MSTPTVLTERYAGAVAYASRLHARDTRKGTEIPYVCHLLGSSGLVIEAGGSEDEAIAALLHDAAEDHGGEDQLAAIKVTFGPEVERIVRECSDSLTALPAEKAPWRERKEAHLRHLREADSSVALVTAADKLHNARALWADLQLDGVDTLHRFNAEPSDIAWYYEEMLDALIGLGVPPLLTLPLADAVQAIRDVIHATQGDADRQRAVSDAPVTARDRWILGDETPFRDRVDRQPLDRDVSPFLASVADDAPDHRYARWSGTAARAVLEALPFASAAAVSCGNRWELRVYVGAMSDLVAAFRSDDTWVERRRPAARWSEMVEGGAEEVGRHLARSYWRLSSRSAVARRSSTRRMPRRPDAKGEPRPGGG